MQYYSQSKEEVLKAQSTSEKNGLTQEEAAKRLSTYGENKLKESGKTSIFKLLLRQISDPMIIILIIAAAVSLAISIIEGGEGIAEVVIIAVVVILNAVLGVVQESKAENAIAALQEMTAATSKVIRDGKQITVKSSEIVPGDIVVLEAGDAVPADMRIIMSASLKIEEAALTGESVPSEKHANILKGGEVPLGDRANMAYMGSTVVYGRGLGVVVGTGMDTEMGKIAGVLAEATESKTPLQRKLGQLSKLLTFIVLGVCVVVFAVRIFTSLDAGISVNLVLDSFIIAVSLAVAAIPEGLASVVTLTLSIGVTKMSKINAVIRRQSAVETLGCTEIICSDKTGTLTQNKMTVVECYGADEELLAKAMCLCCDAKITENGSVGDPTEVALVEYALKKGKEKAALELASPRIGEVPFDSDRKMMTTIHDEKGKKVRYTKGGTDEILKVCNRILKNGEIRAITEEDKEEIRKVNKQLADKALRVLAAAYAEDTEVVSDKAEEMERELIFIGLVGMKDPVRPEVLAAVQECREAGIRPIMITGDHLDTAVAIAMELGIIKDKREAITGADMAKISDEDFATRVQEFSVYARVQPEHKTRIVNAWKNLGKITAMTGDGVNDAPAIKAADIGIGMGITGTDVTKSAADMVLADDNFATIVKAVGEGRRIYDNIRKAIGFLLSSNLAEVVAIFFATMLGFVILEPAHLLWINLIGDTIPAIALGMEKSESDVMKKAPRNSKDGVFADGMGRDILIQGLYFSIITVFAYFLGHFMDTGEWGIPAGGSTVGITMAFLTLAIGKLFHIFNCRSRTRSLFTMRKQNWYIWLAFVACFILTILVVYVPFLAGAFGFTAISVGQFFAAFGLAASIIILVEISKLIVRLTSKHKKA